jgi:hypothetical protein
VLVGPPVARAPTAAQIAARRAALALLARRR